MSMQLHASSAPPLALRQVARRFGRRWALRGVTLRIEPGEIVAVTGPNGSGKSTLLRVAATAMTFTSGEGSVFGHDLRRDAGAVRPLVGLLGHSPGLYDDLTVTENLEFAAAMLDRSRPAAAVAEAVQVAGLGSHARERVKTLSSGWQRRVALARLWMQSPMLLLLDEPYNSMDEEGVAVVNRLIKAGRSRGGAALVVTHALEHATAVTDRWLCLRAGILDGDGSARPRAGGSDSRPELALAVGSGAAASGGGER